MLCCTVMWGMHTARAHRTPDQNGQDLLAVECTRAVRARVRCSYQHELWV